MRHWTHVAGLTGHKTEGVYRRYAIVSESDLASGVRKLARMLEGEADEQRAESAVNASEPRNFPVPSQSGVREVTLRTHRVVPQSAQWRPQPLRI